MGETCLQGFGGGGGQRERDHFLDLSIDGMMMFTLDYQETILKLWTGFSWFGVGIGDYLWTI